MLVVFPYNAHPTWSVMAEIKYKEILHSFCGKNKFQPPSYTCEDEEDSFYCEVSKTVVRVLYFISPTSAHQLRIEGLDFIGCGEARNKKEAQVMAAKLFCEHLVAERRIQPSVSSCIELRSHESTFLYIAGISTI